MGQQHYPIICMPFTSKRENTIVQWALKLNSAQAAEENWLLKGRTLKVKHDTYFCSI
jgi:hypothetical protein